MERRFSGGSPRQDKQAHAFTIKTAIFLCLIISSYSSGAQQNRTGQADKDSITVVAGPQYGRSSFHRWLWGSHYRKDWTTPVKVTKIYLDTAGGGLTPYQAGGGRQSKTLRLRNAREKEYVLRSIDKSFGKALPEILQGTFIESVLNDQVSIAEPYSALTIAPMSEKAGVFHSNPVIGYVPEQPRLDSFNKEFGNTLYLFEQRADENWEEAANFGNSKKIISTEKLFEKISEDNHNQVDQKAYVKARLFDMFIGDWGRHEDQWRWASYEEGDRRIYKPIPRDRDQAYTKFDGVLLKAGIKFAHLEFLQSFGYDIYKVPKLNFPARNLDRRLVNMTTLDDWKQAARELEAAMTDQVIEDAIRQFPPEVYKISGEEITAKLKSRRHHIEEWAIEYYNFQAHEPEVTGSKGSEYFEVLRPNDHETVVNIYDVAKDGTKSTEPYYHRTFKKGETQEVRLFGLAGNDIYHIAGNENDGIKVRIIGGTDTDSIIDLTTGGKNVIVYDNPGNNIQKQSSLKIHLSKDTAINRYQYDDFLFDRKGAKFSIFYSNADRIYASVGYEVVAHKWRRDPYYFKQGLFIRYSLTQMAPNIFYMGVFDRFVAKWDLVINANYDFLQWTNFAGIGNETELITQDANYYRMKSTEFDGNIGLTRRFGEHQTLSFGGVFQSLKIFDDQSRYLDNSGYSTEPHVKEMQYLGGARADYAFQSMNDLIVPTKGIALNGMAGYMQNMSRSDNYFGTFSGTMQLYVPLFGKFSLGIYSGAATVTGKPEFYQLATIGGSRNLRGYHRERFWGQTAVFNSNELRWITSFRSYVMNGKIGLIALFDDGRVWAKGENSTEWHTAYGGGLMLAPFDKFMVSLTYGVSKEASLIHVRFARPL